MVFIFSTNWINQYYWYIKTLKLYFCVGFVFSCYMFFIVYKFTIKFFYNIAVFQISSYLSNTFSSFIIKYLSKILYVLIFGKNVHKSLIFFIIFVTNEIFKIKERKLIRHYYFINIYSIYQNRAIIWKKIV